MFFLALKILLSERKFTHLLTWLVIYSLTFPTGDDHCSMLRVPSHLVSFFPFENRVPKYLKQAANLFVTATRLEPRTT